MTKMRKVVGILLALMLVMGMTSTAFAGTTTYTITINNSVTGHTYEAYQVFDGDLYEKTVGDEVIKTLSNIEWGANVDTTKLPAEYKAAGARAVAEDLADGTINAEGFAKAIEQCLKGNANVSAFANDVYTITGLDAGYYLIKDQNNSLKDENNKDVNENDAYTEFILKVVSNVEATPKSDYPSVTKKVQDTNDSTGVTSDWQDSADYDIGDDITFQLTATMPSNIDKYNTYAVVFHDTLSKGLTFNENVKVTIDGTDATTAFNVTQNETALTISCNDIKDGYNITENTNIVVEYSAKLNENAVTGSEGNANKVKLEYSNNPNGSQTGTTPEDTVVVFTYKLIANKVNEEEVALPGAGFTLYKAGVEGEYAPVGGEVKGEALTTFEWKGLDDGEYRLVETTTPAGYNTIAPIEFTITAEHEVQATAPALTELSGGNVFTADLTAGSLTTDVVNTDGSILPTTGGMGTTLLYLIGGLLVVAAGATLVMRRRAND